MFFFKKKKMKKLVNEIIDLFNHVPHIMKQEGQTYFLTTHNILLTFDNKEAQISFSKNFITNQTVCSLTLLIYKIFNRYGIKLYVNHDFYENESNNVLFDSAESLDATNQFFEDLRNNIQNVGEVEHSKIQ